MQMKFVVALHKYFGRLPGQTLEEFAKEIRALTPADKEELRELLGKELKEEVLSYDA